MTEHDGLERSSELLPCPFCGGEATLLVNGKSGSWTFHHEGRPNCPAAYSHCAEYKTEADAIATWNSRPREDELQAALNKAAGNWARAERTCHDVNEDDHDFTCSECGASMYTQTDDCWTMIARGGLCDDVIESPNFCPNCGAKVVEP